jgi:hypothetical protein
MLRLASRNRSTQQILNAGGEFVPRHRPRLTRHDRCSAQGVARRDRRAVRRNAAVPDRREACRRTSPQAASAWPWYTAVAGETCVRDPEPIGQGVQCPTMKIRRRRDGRSARFADQVRERLDRWRTATINQAPACWSARLRSATAPGQGRLTAHRSGDRWRFVSLPTSARR